MTMTFVATTSPSFARRGSVIPDRMQATGWRFERYDDMRLADGGIGSVLGEVEYLVSGIHPVTEETLDAAPNLRAVLKHGVGVDNIDIAACTARGIPVTNAPGANANSVAELAIGMALNLSRHLQSQHAAIVDGGWERATGRELSGRTLGIVGFGDIGRLTAEKAQALGMNVIVTDLNADTFRDRFPQYEFTTLPDVLARADILSLHVSGGASNAQLIDKAAIAAMKPGALLINAARGEVVDDIALAEALESGRLGGAAIDAHVIEPPDLSRPIYSAKNTLFTPHIGAETEESITRVGGFVMDDIETFLAGGRPDRCLNPEVFGASAETAADRRA